MEMSVLDQEVIDLRKELNAAFTRLRRARRERESQEEILAEYHGRREEMMRRVQDLNQQMRDLAAAPD